MKTIPAQILLGIISAGLVMFVTVFIVSSLSKGKILGISDYKRAFIIVAVIGFILCTIFMGKLAMQLGWTNWSIISGIILGSLATIIIIAQLVGWKLPVINDYKSAFIALLVIVTAKMALAVIPRVTG